jgi:osmotically-inducible protein OsmY
MRAIPSPRSPVSAPAIVQQRDDTAVTRPVCIEGHRCLAHGVLASGGVSTRRRCGESTPTDAAAYATPHRSTVRQRTHDTLAPPVVKSDIEAALKRRAAADAKTIAVDVKGRDVTPTGTVHSWSERDLATRPAWGTAGVHHVVDKMSLVY